MRQAKEPFQFVAASYLVRICSERAKTLADMARGMRTCPATSIFYHTFQSIESHNYAAFSSDFAQWIMAACNEAALAERLAVLDLHEFISLEELREALAGTVENHVHANPTSAERPAFEPFHFCEAVEVSIPLQTQAVNLGELAEGIRHLSLQTLHHHFINSRLRLRLATNDFSYWIEQSLELPEPAARLNRIDFYNNTLEEVREEILSVLQPWIGQ
jgi:hypothetical protein